MDQLQLTKDEIITLLGLLTATFEIGYSKDPKISRLQAKLSIMLEIAENRGEN